MTRDIVPACVIGLVRYVTIQYERVQRAVKVCITYLTFSTSFYLDELNPVKACDPDPITSNSLLSTMTEILLIACFSNHTTTRNEWWLIKVTFTSYVFHCVLTYCQLDAFCHHFNKALMYVSCMYVSLPKFQIQIQFKLGYTQQFTRVTSAAMIRPAL